MLIKKISVQNSVQENYHPEFIPRILHLTKNVPPTFILLVAPTMYGLPYPSPKHTIWEKPCRWGENPTQQQKTPISNTRKIPLVK